MTTAKEAGEQGEIMAKALWGPKKMKTYTLDICFTMETDKEPEDWTSGQIQQALLERLNSLTDGEMLEAVGIVEVEE